MGDDVDGGKAENGVADDKLAKMEEENRYVTYGKDAFQLKRGKIASGL